jgi:hypothetical protein
MWLLGIKGDGLGLKERRLWRNSTCATVPAGTVHRKAAVRAREEARVLGARNTGRGALPTAGKREGISF